MNTIDLDKFEKTVDVQFVIDGIVCGSGFVTVRDGRLDTEDAEEEFYKTLRKNEKTIIEEAEEDIRDEIVSTLTDEQEDKLKEAHAKDYAGTDDDMPDAYEDWLMDLSLEEVKNII